MDSRSRPSLTAFNEGLLEAADGSDVVNITDARRRPRLHG